MGQLNIYNPIYCNENKKVINMVWQLDTLQLCTFIWYELIQTKLNLDKKMNFHITQHRQCETRTMFQVNQLNSQGLQWHNNGCDGVSNHHPPHCLLSRLFRRWSKKTSKIRVTVLCVGNSPVTDEFPAQRDSNAENVSIWWRHHAGMNLTSDPSRLTRYFGKASTRRYSPLIFKGLLIFSLSVANEIQQTLCLFVKLEELHIATAHKPLIHPNQPIITCYQHRNQPCMS